MLSYALVGARLQWRYPPGEPGVALLLTGGAQRFLGISNTVPVIKWEEVGALPASGKVLAGARQRKANEHPPTWVLSFFVTCHATSRVTVMRLSENKTVRNF